MNSRLFLKDKNNGLSRCHTKRRTGARSHARPSFGVTPTFPKKKKKIIIIIFFPKKNSKKSSCQKKGGRGRAGNSSRMLRWLVS